MGNYSSQPPSSRTPFDPLREGLEKLASDPSGRSIVELRRSLIALLDHPDPELKKLTQCWAAALGAWAMLLQGREAEEAALLTAECGSLFLEGADAYFAYVAACLEPFQKDRARWKADNPGIFDTLHHLSRLAVAYRKARDGDELAIDQALEHAEAIHRSSGGIVT